MSTESKPIYFTVLTGAKLLQVDSKTLTKALRENRIPVSAWVQMGTRKLPIFSEDDLNEFQKLHKVRPIDDKKKLKDRRYYENKKARINANNP